MLTKTPQFLGTFELDSLSYGKYLTTLPRSRRHFIWPVLEGRYKEAQSAPIAQGKGFAQLVKTALPDEFFLTQSITRNTDGHQVEQVAIRYQPKNDVPQEKQVLRQSRPLPQTDEPKAWWQRIFKPSAPLESLEGFYTGVYLAALAMVEELRAEGKPLTYSQQEG